ncbi:hypothetical protein HK104_007160 [Borealophlyctis nickersoniae]|nr:hypothetical protein HK104_007160 [Borealophlyctis nickersoniae]
MPPLIPVVPPPLSRLQAITSVARQIGADSPLPTRSGVRTNAYKLLAYYPPNVDIQSLSQQDPRLTKLGLIDVWLHEAREREIRLEKRGKVILRSVLGRKAVPKTEEGAADKTKKKKKR